MKHFLKQIRHKIHRFAAGHYNLLLSLLFLLFLFRPYQHEGFYVGIWKIFLTAALMLAIFNVHHQRAVKIIASILAIPAVLFTWYSIFDQNEFIISAICVSNALFMAVCAASILYDVVLRARVTVETLRGVVSAYFLIAFIFAYLYLLIEAINPGSITIHDQVLDVFANPHYYFSLMLYYSFVTLLTIGYGDIVSIRDISQTACVIEGIIGQFYIAILVARLVSVYSFFSDKRLLQNIEQDIHEGKKGS